MFRYLSDAEFDTVRERATEYEGETRSAGRMAAGVILGLHGLRCSEVCGLRVTDLDAGRGALHVDTLKHGEPRDVDLKPRIATWLAKLAQGQPASAPLFRTCRARALHPSVSSALEPGQKRALARDKARAVDRGMSQEF
jgi:integrase